jgi:integrase
VRVNPTLGVRVNRRRDEPQEEAEAKALTRAELARVLGELPEEWWLFFELLTHTGLRVSEAIGLTWGDVEFGARSRVRVRRQHYRGETKRLKSRNGRRDLPLSTGLARRLWPLRGAPEALLFATRAGTPLHDGNLRRRVLRPAAERAGVPWVGFHTFRHTCASLLFAGGKDIKQVSGWLGHADPAFTLRTYVHLMDEGLGEADFLDDAVTVGNAGATGDPAKAASSAPVEVAM